MAVAVAVVETEKGKEKVEELASIVVARLGGGSG